jgi:alpha/beta hydrolase fold
MAVNNPKPLQACIRQDSFTIATGTLDRDEGEQAQVQTSQQTEGRARFGPYETWYRITGDLASKKPPVFILHGGPGVAHNYVDSYKLLSRDGRAVIHYDQLGCGNSTLLPEKGRDFWMPQLFVDELENLVDALGQRAGVECLLPNMARVGPGE